MRHARAGRHRLAEERGGRVLRPVPLEPHRARDEEASIRKRDGTMPSENVDTKSESSGAVETLTPLKAGEGVEMTDLAMVFSMIRDAIMRAHTDVPRLRALLERGLTMGITNADGVTLRMHEVPGAERSEEAGRRLLKELEALEVYAAAIKAQRDACACSVCVAQRAASVTP